MNFLGERDPVPPEHDESSEGNSHDTQREGSDAGEDGSAGRTPEAEMPTAVDGTDEPQRSELDPEAAGQGRMTFFEEYARRPLPPPPRFPNIADVGIGLLLMFFGWLIAGALTVTALRLHLFGVTSMAQALKDIHYTLGSQAVWYLVTFGECLLLFPAVWHAKFFDGLEWNVSAASRLRRRLMAAVGACFLLALLDGILLPGPQNTPIDQVFRLPGAAWALFAFGVTLAPFFEEMAFRGLLLPALCTAWDWTMERVQHRSPPWPDADGRTRWSMSAMVGASLLTSIPFALIHGQQTSYSLGPFLLLICVSGVLCWIRLSTRSLAASTVVHSCYNLLLFLLMFAGTGGFRHLDKM